MMQATFLPGDPVPWFAAACGGNPRFQLSAVAGRHVVLCFLGSTRLPPSAALMRAVAAARHLFDDRRATFFAVSIDRRDQAEGRIGDRPPGLRVFWDFDLAVSRLYGAVDDTASGEDALSALAGYRPFWLLLDPMLRVVRTAPLDPPEPLLRRLAAQPSPGLEADTPTPVLMLPRVFEPGFCRELIRLHQAAGGGIDSGFMRDLDGLTVPIIDHRHKRRFDCLVEDEALRQAARARILRRLVPEVAKAFQFQATRMERYVVACYDAEGGGYFRSHRDNTTKATAHRRFAVSINLNAEDHEGGDLRFPEFGMRTWRPPTGGALVFSCSLLHEATPITAGRRYAFLPFLYDEAAAAQRQENQRYLSTEAPRRMTGAVPERLTNSRRGG